MKTKYLAAALAAVLLTACSDTAPGLLAPEDALLTRGAPEFSFTSIEVPGAAFTQATGIGPGGDIVGHYLSGGVIRGFLLRRGEFTPIDFPGAGVTIARGLGPNGEIVGTFRWPGEAPPVERGFLLSPEGEYSEIAVEGYKHVIPQRILADGTIVGCVHDDDTMASMKGVVIGRRGTRVDDIFASMHNGATPNGRRLAGLYTNTAAGRVEGYLLENGVFTPLLAPGSVFTAAWDMNPAGDVVGVYNLPGPVVRGFLLTRDGYTTIHFPGAAHTRAFGINAAGDVVGHYISGGVTRGYVASRTGRPTH
jgi:hypothetical protein